MKNSILLLIITVLLISSCKKEDDYENKLIGKWQIKSVKKERPLLTFTDISDEVKYQDIKFYDNHTVKLFFKDSVQPVEGNWSISYDTNYLYYGNDDGTGTPVIEMKLTTTWSSTPKYFENTYIDILTNKKLNFYCLDGNKQIIFKCSR